jgi:intraflagellar transport protein 46
MPDIDTLMQEWPSAFEEMLRTVPLPSAAMNMSTEEYARVVCALLDVPVHPPAGGAAPTIGPLIQSLHLVFSLYLEFRDNPHFASMLEGARVGAPE